MKESRLKIINKKFTIQPLSNLEMCAIVIVEWERQCLSPYISREKIMYPIPTI